MNIYNKTDEGQSGRPNTDHPVGKFGYRPTTSSETILYTAKEGSVYYLHGGPTPTQQEECLLDTCTNA